MTKQTTARFLRSGDTIVAPDTKATLTVLSARMWGRTITVELVDRGRQVHTLMVPNNAPVTRLV